jgi:ribonuclease BN (tRNA processing enzyme)
LNENEQLKIRNILITHSHLDHIKAIPFLGDNIIIRKKGHGVNLYGIRQTLFTLKKNLLNDKLWPDFTKISTELEPVFMIREISPGKPFTVDHYSITACRVNHTVDAVGYIVTDRKGRSLLYTGDTGPTNDIWKVQDKVDAVIVEVSFPNNMEKLARKTGHLTARLMKKELDKIKYPPKKVFLTHPKPHYIRQIKKEMGQTGDRRLSFLKEGRIYEI